MKEGWQTKTLGQLCYLVSGQHINSKDYNTDSRGVGYLTGPSDFGSVNPVISKWTESPKVKAKCGDILVTVKGSGVGKINLLDQDNVAISRQLMAVRVTGADPRFVYAMLSSTFEHFQSLATGAAIPGISREQVLGLEIAIPSLPEQQRIVDILDEAFVGIAIAKANAEKNLQNARALFEGHLQAVFTKRGDGWVDTKLDDVCGFQNGFAFKSSSFKQSGYPILRISNIQGGRVDTEKLVFFDPKDYRENLDRYRIVEDDLLIAMSGATTGKLGFNTESTVFYLNQRVGKFEPGKKLNKRFLYYFLSTKVEENLRISAGSAQPNLSTEQIKGFVLPLPGIDEQHHIVAALESLSEKTQHLEVIYQQKLTAFEELKKSLLHQAFNGQL